MNNLITKKRCANFRVKILEISQQVQALHIGSAFSCLEIVDAIYYEIMQSKKECLSKDTFIMSKGHGSMIQNVILEDLGLLTKKDLLQYCTKTGILGCHPDIDTPGITAATGSLGHGLSISVGIAYSKIMLNDKSLVHCVISDGELQEGSTWEAILLASSLKLPNLICYVDNNNFQSLEKTSVSHPSFYPLVEKFEAFHWKAFEVDGHDTISILQCFEKRSMKGPTIIICKTTKGKGVSFMENVPIWHYRSPNKEEYTIALNELSREII